ncbi:hypothetical protein ATEIFO6365_0004087900 [Aspergillus terreus]|uniref:Uncharacterized protein n=1 Tax=Aspergillus terreus TaxID=33178 RepID=A0A5M3YRX3_ASPTE|nr:hypothetical protein ATETN484_0002090400 [Aspergillus terreus]GFF15760.1 hypothetical protein ATEIFO6365_0004087900 [Aspergillus terreus]
MPPLQSTPTSSQVAPTWVAQLDSELQRASIPDRSIEAFEFSDILIQTLLSGDTSLDAEETDRIVSIITQDIERVTRILQPASLRTLAVLLVRSYFQHAQNIGLDLLVRASQVGNSGSKSPGIYFEKSDKVLVDQELGRCLYHLFNNGDQEVPFRRLAGKLFLAVTANVEDNADAFLSPSQAELSRTTDILTHGTDKILTFLASTILTSFCRCGINIPNIPQTERNFVEYVKASPGDTIENFYHHEQTKNDQQTNQATQACNLLQSLHIDGNPLVIGPIAASLSANALTLLYAVNATAGRCFDYLEIPLGAILDVSPLTIDSMSTLVLTLDSSMMTVNGPDNVLQGQKLRLTSKESLKDLETAIHAAAGSRRCGVREGIPVTRKTSSTLISLDLGNEIDNVIGNREVGSSPNRGHQEQSQRPMSQAKAMCTEDQIETLSETEGKADAQNVQNAEVVQTNRVPENVIEKSDQNVRRNLPYQLRSLSSKTNPPAQFTNTQESLMFHRQKPGQKVYTSHSKAAVDWDEDLRQSSDNHDGTTNQHSEKEESSSGESFLQEETEDKPKTPQEGCHSGSKSEENHNPLTNHDQRHMERGGLDTAQYTLTTLKATDTQNMTELIKDSTGSDRGAEIAVEENVGVGNAIDQTPHEEHGDSLTTNEYGSGGRGKAVGRKLAAAFKDFDTQGSEGSFEQRYPKVGTHNIEVTVLEHDGEPESQV